MKQDVILSTEADENANIPGYITEKVVASFLDKSDADSYIVTHMYDWIRRVVDGNDKRVNSTFIGVRINENNSDL